jgi:hypothetical protein
MDGFSLGNGGQLPRNIQAIAIINVITGAGDFLFFSVFTVGFSCQNNNLPF